MTTVDQLSVAAIAEDRKNLIALIEEFEHDDDYHVLHGELIGEEGLDPRTYHAAINRVVALLRGDIKDWTSPRP